MKIEVKQDGSVWHDGVPIYGAKCSRYYVPIRPVMGCKYIAMDSDGDVYAFTNRPIIVSGITWVDMIESEKSCYLYTLASVDGWQNSLREIDEEPNLNSSYSEKTLRDEFAMIAMRGMNRDEYSYATIAKSAYELADEMMAAREQNKEK